LTSDPLVISANIGFLYAELPLPERVHAAREDGFDAVEMHWPYDTDPAEVKRALAETGMPCICLNTRPGDPKSGEFGLGALPGREVEANEAVEEAVAYAAATGCRNVHAMAGKIAGKDLAAHAAFVANLQHAADTAKPHGIGILIEPINSFDVPGYFLNRFEQAADIISATARETVGMMFDMYHASRMGLDIAETYGRYGDVVRHVQFASIPSRREPDTGAIDIASNIAVLRNLGYRGAFGAEYRPKGHTRDGLGWLSAFRAALNSNP
jgi:2-dehydrotetronate isomerase